MFFLLDNLTLSFCFTIGIICEIVQVFKWQCIHCQMRTREEHSESGPSENVSSDDENEWEQASNLIAQMSLI